MITNIKSLLYVGTVLSTLHGLIYTSQQFYEIIPLPPLLFRWGNWGIEKANTLQQAPELVQMRREFEHRTSESRACFFNHHAILPQSNYSMIIFTFYVHYA